MTDVGNNQQQSSPNPTNLSNPISHGYNIMDNAINAAMANVLSGKSLNITPKTALYIILFSSVNEIKEITIWALKKLCELGYMGIKNIITYIIRIVKYVLLLRFLKTKKKLKKINTANQNEIKYTSLSLTDNYQIFDAILSYIDNSTDPNNTYNYQIVMVNTKNLQQCIEKKLIKDIHLKFNNMIVKFKTSIFAEYENNQINKIYIEDIKNNKEDIMIEFDKNDILSSLSRLISNKKIADIFDKHYSKIEEIATSSYYAQTLNTIKYAPPMYLGQTNITAENILAALLLYYKKNSNQLHLFLELIILIQYGSYDVRFDDDKIYFDKLDTYIKFPFTEISNSTMMTHMNGISGMNAYTMSGMISTMPINNISNNQELKLSSCRIDNTRTYSAFYYFEQHKKIFDEEFDKIIKTLKVDKKEIIVNTNIIMDLEIHTDKSITNSISLWNKYLYDEIINPYLDKQHKINEVNVYTLKLEESNEEIEESNPEYDEYIAKKDIFGTISKDSDTDADILIKVGLHIIPPKTIKKNIKSYKVIANKEGNVSKRLDTLYLRKQDSKKLKAILKNYQERTDIYEDLCINKKLGIMLHGDPGTGKSSTIIAIATHLNYDIYYISMNGIATNEQLKMIFDFVSKNCSKKGMMVFEDIDAQTNVVHARVNESNNKKDDDLDLAFFLNLLDGTIAHQEMVYCITTNHLERLDPALYRKGRINVMIHLKKCDHYQINCIFEKVLNRKLDSHILETIPEDTYTPAEVIHHLMENIHSDITDEEIIKKLKL
jgi:hypothetical protein